MLELYHHGTSVCAAKPRIVLAEKNVPWTGRYVDILKNEQFAPDYVKLNPKHVVPTLVHDGHVIRESTIICEYLDEAFPDVPLKPDSALDRVTMRMWTKRLDEELHAATSVVPFAISHRHAVIANGPEVVQRYIDQGGPAQRERRKARLERGVDDPAAHQALRVYDSFLADMETQLAQTPWLAGARFSLAEAGGIGSGGVELGVAERAMLLLPLGDGPQSVADQKGPPSCSRHPGGHADPFLRRRGENLVVHLGIDSDRELGRWPSTGHGNTLLPQ